MNCLKLFAAALSVLSAVACSAPTGVPYFQDATDSVTHVGQASSNAFSTLSADDSQPKVGVIGEVARPGRYVIDREVYTVLDAISDAGDLTIYGKRDNVRVIRRSEDGGVNTYVLDFSSAESVLNSPAYVLVNDDIVYVEPNRMRTRQSTVNGNSLVSAPFWISVASLIATITFCCLKL